jgi:hypothetical protein
MFWTIDEIVQDELMKVKEDPFYSFLNQEQNEKSLAKRNVRTSIKDSD